MITTLDGLIEAMNYSQQGVIAKASQSSVSGGVPISLWTVSGTPTAGAVPTTAAICTRATEGAALDFTNAGSGKRLYMGRLFLLCSISSADVQIYDRIAHMGGLSGSATTSQSVDLSVTDSGLADRIGNANYSDVAWWAEIYTAIGGTARNLTVTYTNGAGTSGRTTVVPLFGATSLAQNRATRLHRIVGDGNEAIQSIQSVQLDASTGAAGDFGITASRSLTGMPLGLANASELADWSRLGLPIIEDDTCLWLVMYPGSTTSGTLQGSFKLIEG